MPHSCIGRPAKTRCAFTMPSQRRSAPWSRRRHVVLPRLQRASRAGGLAGRSRLATRRKYRVMIDHHQEPEPFADVMLSDPTTGSTCELIYRLLQAWGMEEARTPTWPRVCTAASSPTRKLRFSSVQPSATTWPRSCSRRHGPQPNPQFDLRRLPLGTGPTHSHALSQKLQVFPEHRSAIISLISRNSSVTAPKKATPKALSTVPWPSKGSTGALSKRMWTASR